MTKQQGQAKCGNRHHNLEHLRTHESPDSYGKLGPMCRRASPWLENYCVRPRQESAGATRVPHSVPGPENGARLRARGESRRLPLTVSAFSRESCLARQLHRQRHRRRPSYGRLRPAAEHSEEAGLGVGIVGHLDACAEGAGVEDGRLGLHNGDAGLHQLRIEGAVLAG